MIEVTHRDFMSYWTWCKVRNGSTNYPDSLFQEGGKIFYFILFYLFFVDKARRERKDRRKENSKGKKLRES